MNKDGNRFNRDDKLEIMDKSSMMTMTYSENHYKQYTVLYVINEKIFNSNGEYTFPNFSSESILNEYKTVNQERINEYVASLKDFKLIDT